MNLGTQNMQKLVDATVRVLTAIAVYYEKKVNRL